jgi:hypothetical protein
MHYLFFWKIQFFGITSSQIWPSACEIMKCSPPAEKSNTKKRLGCGYSNCAIFTQSCWLVVFPLAPLLSSSSLVFDVLLCGSNDIVKGGHETSKFPIAPLEVTRFPCFVAAPGDHALCLFHPTPESSAVSWVVLPFTRSQPINESDWATLWPSCYTSLSKLFIH